MPSTRPAARNGYLARFVRALIDKLWGYDFFISYSSKDGPGYPACLFHALRYRGYSPFLDQVDYVGGMDLEEQTVRRIRMSRKLLLIARPNILEPATEGGKSWVLREVETAIASGREVIVIDVNKTVAGAQSDHQLPGLVRNRVRISEQVEDLDQAPSEHVLDELDRSHRALKAQTRRVLILAVATAALVMLGVALFFAIRTVQDQLVVEQAAMMRTDADLRRTLGRSPRECAEPALRSLVLHRTPAGLDSLHRIYSLHPRVVADYSIEAGVARVEFAHDGDWVAIQDKARTLRIYDLDALKVAPELPNVSGWTPRGHARFDSGLAITGGRLAKWSVGRSDLEFMPADHERQVEQVEYVANGARFVTLGKGELCLWSNTIEYVMTLGKGVDGEFQVSPDGKWIVVCEKSRLRAWCEGKTRDEWHEVPDDRLRFSGEILEFAFDPADRRSATDNGAFAILVEEWRTPTLYVWTRGRLSEEERRYTGFGDRTRREPRLRHDSWGWKLDFDFPDMKPAPPSRPAVPTGTRYAILEKGMLRLFDNRTGEQIELSRSRSDGSWRLNESGTRLSVVEEDRLLVLEPRAGLAFANSAVESLGFLAEDELRVRTEARVVSVAPLSGATVSLLELVARQGKQSLFEDNEMASASGRTLVAHLITSLADGDMQDDEFAVEVYSVDENGTSLQKSIQGDEPFDRDVEIVACSDRWVAIRQSEDAAQIDFFAIGSKHRISIDPPGSDISLNAQGDRLLYRKDGRIWVESFPEREILVDGANPGNCDRIAFVENGMLMGFGEAGVVLWRVDDMKEVLRVDGARPEQVDCSAGSSWISHVCGRVVTLIDLTSGKRKELVHDSPVIAAAVGNEAEGVVATAVAGSVFVWRFCALEPVAVFPHSGTVTSIDFSPSGELIAFGDSAGLISTRYWRTRDLIAAVKSDVLRDTRIK